MMQCVYIYIYVLYLYIPFKKCIWNKCNDSIRNIFCCDEMKDFNNEILESHVKSFENCQFSIHFFLWLFIFIYIQAYLYIYIQYLLFSFF